MTDADSGPSSDGERTLGRRSFLLGSAAAVGTVSLLGGVFVTFDGRVSADPWLRGEATEIAPPPTDAPRHWLGPELWGNRLQDWQNTGGRIECLRGDAGHELRTVGVLTRELVPGDDPCHLGTVTGVAAGEDGFAGLLLGVGEGDLDHRAAALAGRSAGAGGGVLCTYETDGRVRFRDHSDEAAPLAYDVLPADGSAAEPVAGAPARGDGVRLSVDVVPQTDGRFTLLVEATAVASAEPLAQAVRRDVPGESLLGGVALVSSPPPGKDGTRWWFDGLETAGPKVERHPDRTFGPVVGTLYSLDDSVLKLSAQLFPMAASDPETVRLRYRPADGGEWRTERATLGDGHVATFRVEGWDAGRAWDYRVVYRDGAGDEWRYEGRIAADPGTAEDLTIGLVGCTSACGRWLDSGPPPRDGPGRYTPENIYAPYGTLTRNLRAHDPDLLVSVGDQFYETRPTHPDDREAPGLDLLYRWFLWHWSFRDVTRNTPTVVLVDDHDVYQGNLWGSGGEDVPAGDRREGGYVASPDTVNLVQRLQCSHNPDPYDPTPVGQGIDTYYGSFRYGGTRFAMLEDRKFKTGPAERERRGDEGKRAGDGDDRAGEGGAELLGDRQERFLEEWAAEGGDSPSVCLTQTVFAGALTTPGGKPKPDRDTNGFPKPGRDRAVRLLRDAGALVLAGDQHLPTLVRHGVDDPADGVVQFTGPAGGAFFLRWFEPAKRLPNGTGHPHTGEYVDAFGNPFRMLAVANPDVRKEAFRGDDDPVVFDREPRSDGYGVVRVDHDDRAFHVECWPRTADPDGGAAAQFRGWPFRLPFDETDGREG